MIRIKITKAEQWNWYKTGDEYFIKDSKRYAPLGVQVFKANNRKEPDVVEFGHFEYVE